MGNIILNCRGVKDSNDGMDREEKEKQRKNSRTLLGLKEHDIFLTKEQSVIKSIMKTFKKHNIQTQYSVLMYKIDVYFPDHKLAIEIDEKGHTDRNKRRKKERQNALEKELSCTFIRINPDTEDFGIFEAIS